MLSINNSSSEKNLKNLKLKTKLYRSRLKTL